MALLSNLKKNILPGTGRMLRRNSAAFCRMLLSSFIVLMLLPGKASAQDNPIIAVLDGNKNQIAVDSSVQVVDTIWYDPSMQNQIIKPYDVQSLVTLRINEDAGFALPDSFTVTVNFMVSYEKENNTLDSLSRQLTIHYDSSTTYNARNYFTIEGTHFLKVRITGISIPSNVNIAKSMLVEAEMRPSREYSFTSCSIKAVKSVTPLLVTDDELKVRWTNRTGADEYDLEWAWVDNAALNQHYYGPDPSNPNLNLIFRNNTTRVSTSGITYTIPLIYPGPATLFIRVRPVKFVDGNRVAADWSSDFLPDGLLKYQITTNGHESKLNWQSTISFAEDGKKKVVVQYYDGSLRSRQTVTKDNSTKTTVVAQTFYDYQGRPAIQVLPCPTLATVIGYTANFNKAVGSDGYEKSKYDEITGSDYCTAHAAPMENNNSNAALNTGASVYYSQYNPMVNNGSFKYIPDAEQYPYTQTEYTPDNTGRISRQGGVGPTFQLGSGHETKYYYAITPDQSELDALFGTEVGDHTHYFKNAVQDANGQFSVSYVDMHGRTIATALAGASPASMQALTSNQLQSITETIADATTNTTKGLVMESHKSLLVTNPDVYHFVYELSPQDLKDPDCNGNEICYDCFYNLKVTITDDCNNSKIGTGGKPFVYEKGGLSFNFLHESCTQPSGQKISLDFYITLPVGNYEITKTLTVDEKQMDKYLNETFLPNNTCKTLQDFITEARSENHLANCSLDCESCKTSLGSKEDFHQNYVTTVIGTASYTGSADQEKQIDEAYNNALADCDLLCGDLTKDNNDVRKAMLFDMTPPSGQYAQKSTTDPFSIFFTGNYTWRGSDATRTDPLYKQATGYKNDDGTDAKVFINSPSGGSWFTPQQLTPDQFIAYFQPKWAEALLPFHPEYCKLEAYEATLGSTSFDNRMEATDKYVDAKERRYTEPLNQDPLQTENPDIFGDLRYAYDNYQTIDFGDGTGTHTLTMWQTAVLFTECNSDNQDDAKTCMQDKILHTGLALSDLESCPGDMDMAWRNFRQIYLGEKRNLLYKDYYSRTCEIRAEGESMLIGRDEIPALTSIPINADDPESKHTIHFMDPDNALPDDLDYMDPNHPDDTKQATKEKLNEFYAENCASYIPLWTQQLADCHYSPEVLNQIIAQLLEVCKGGADDSHPYGSRNVSPANEPTAVYDNFDEVINAFNGGAKSLTCNADMLTVPAAYNAQPAYNTFVYSAPDPEVCDKISTYNAEYTTQAPEGMSFYEYMMSTYPKDFSAMTDAQYNQYRAAYDKAIDEESFDGSFYDYVQYRTDDNIVFMTETDFNLLTGSCLGTSGSDCNFFDHPVTVPPIFQENTGETCLTCVRMDELYNQYLTTYPGEQFVPVVDPQTEQQKQANTLFTNFMNNQLGFGLTAIDYLAFKAQCDPLIATLLKIQVHQDEPIACNGGATSVTITATGGTKPYTLNDAGTTSNFTSIKKITGVHAGSHCYIVTDAAGHVATATISITEPAAIVVTVGTKGILCYETGADIDVKASNGIAPYTYSIDGVNFTSNDHFTGVAAGTYTIYVKDAHECTGQTSLTIANTQPDKLCVVATRQSWSQATNTATITIDAYGGTTPYTTPVPYTVTAGPGTHTYTVTDANGCSSSVNVTVTAGDNSAAVFTTPGCTATLKTSVQFTPIACKGGSTSVTITATGGTPPYQVYIPGSGYVNFTNGSSTVIMGVTAGAHYYTVKDNSTGTATVSVNLVEPTELIVTTQIQSSDCKYNSASVSISASGGVPPYSGTGTFTQAKGTHAYTVTDANGCTKEVPVTVSQICLFASSKGMYMHGYYVVNITASGGAGPYRIQTSYGWQTFSSSWPIYESTQGLHKYTVYDSKDCSAYVSIEIKEGQDRVAYSSNDCKESMQITSQNVQNATANSNLESTDNGTGNTCAYSNAGSICVSCDILQDYINNYFNGEKPPATYQGQQLDAGSEDGMLTYLQDKLRIEKQIYTTKENIQASLSACNTSYAHNVFLDATGGSWVFGQATTTHTGGPSRVPPNLQLGTGNFSIETWANFINGSGSGTEPGTPGSQAILTYANTNFHEPDLTNYAEYYHAYWKSGFKGYYLYRRDGYLYFLLGDGTYVTGTDGIQHGNYIWVKTASFISSSQWHHIAVTRTGNSWTGIKIYVDGTLQTTSCVDGHCSLGSSGNVSLPVQDNLYKQPCGLMLASYSCNSSGGATTSQDVSLKNVKIYKTLLSSQTIYNDYLDCSGEGISTDDQLALWAKIAEGTGNVLDASINKTGGFWLGLDFTTQLTGDYRAWGGGKGPAQSPQCKVNDVTALCYDVNNDWPTLCGKTSPIFPVWDGETTDNCSDEDDFAVSIGTERYQDYIESITNDFETQYKAKCLDAYKYEKFTVTHDVSEYHYTLYYYDQSGNLTMTIPPKAVVPNRSQSFLDQVKTARASGTTLIRPGHTMALATKYRYNTLNQIIGQWTPDAGKTNSFYDRLGRLVLSKNAKQAVGDAGNTANKKYSYTVYDALGRIAEVGQLKSATMMTLAKSKDETELKAWMDAAWGTREQVTKTYYDVAYPVSLTGILTQQNLRSRVTWSGLYSDGTKADAIVQFSSATIYSYDIHGNADVVLQDYGNSTYSPNAMNTNGNRYKKITYDYDLISGKVNMVSYQPRNKEDDPLNKDAFYHRYSYDAENRLIDVETSSDSIYWEHDAHYNYYKHGPLARLVLGQNQVQGIDYAYTLQGWLKGVNTTAPGGVNDMGVDGYNTGNNGNVAKDVFGFALYYYGNSDYKPIKQNETPFVQVPVISGASSQPFKPLYNGNIASMVVNINAFGVNVNNGVGNKPLAYMYSYDQLNRLVAMQTVKHGGTNFSGNAWINPALINDYKENISYDANGNILTYSRYSNSTNTGSTNAAVMDNLTYTYDNNSNQLLQVYDPTTTPTISTDLEGNISYTYDVIGNLITDNSDGITTNIDWSVYGKILTVNKGSTTITYTYDASGNRISKKVTGASSGNGETWYVRDAGGNVMAVYTANNSSVNSGHLTLSEQTIYGSSRLGIIKPNTDMLGPGPTAITIPGLSKPGYLYKFVRGQKFFELNNHLENVLVVITDKRKGVFSGSVLQYYIANVVSASDYYPFGMSMPGRTYTASSAGGYRYGFNGKELDKEVSSTTTYDYGFRIYSPALGRFLSVDPLAPKFAFYTPYQFSSNNPVTSIDLDGLESVIAIMATKITKADPPTQQQASENLSKLSRETQIKTDVVNWLVPQLKIPVEFGTYLSSSERQTIITETVNDFMSFNFSESLAVNMDGSSTRTLSATADINYQLLFEKSESNLLESIKTSFEEASTINETFGSPSDMVGPEWLQFGYSGLQFGHSIYNKDYGDAAYNAIEITSKLLEKGVEGAVRIGLLKTTATIVAPRLLGTFINVLSTLDANCPSRPSFEDLKAAQTKEVIGNTISAMLFYFMYRNTLNVSESKPAQPKPATDHPEDKAYEKYKELE